MMVQKLQECKVTKFVSLQVHTHSDGHKHHKQQQGAQVSVLEVNGKESTFQIQVGTIQQLNSLQNIQDASCSIYKWLQSSYCIFSRFQVSCQQYLEIYMFLYIQATPLSIQWMKNFSLDYKAAILSWRNAINVHVCCEYKSLIVLLCCEC